MILWYAFGYESLLTRLTHTRALCHRWRDVTRRRAAHVAGQPWQHQGIVAPAPDQRLACPKPRKGQTASIPAAQFATLRFQLEQYPVASLAGHARRWNAGHST